MKFWKHFTAALGVTASLLMLGSCNNDQNTGSNDNAGTQQDTNVTDTRRYSTDTINYLTKDTSKAGQEKIDPDPPQ